MKLEDEILLSTIIDKINSDPSFFPYVISALTAGMEKAVDQARSDQSQWEAIAIQAMAAREFGKHKKATLAMIEKVLPRACFRWDSILEALRK